MSPSTPAPRGLAWLGGTAGTVLAYAVAIGSIVLSIFVLNLYQDFADCTAQAQRADGARTAILAPYTDAERAADRRLLLGPEATGQSGAALREASLRAREETDRARAANPPPSGRICGK